MLEQKSGASRRGALLDAGGAGAQAGAVEEHPACSPSSANGTYHRVYDPCIPKFLNQAGVKTDFVRFEDVGITGNSHVMMLEKNSDDIIKYIAGWLQKNVN